jgi:hypothetical protein
LQFFIKHNIFFIFSTCYMYARSSHYLLLLPGSLCNCTWRRGSNPCSGCLTPVGLRITMLPWDGSLGLARAGGNGWRKVPSVFAAVTGCGDGGACCWTTGPPPEDSKWTAVCGTADAGWCIPLSWLSASHQNIEILDVSLLNSSTLTITVLWSQTLPFVLSNWNCCGPRSIQRTLQ